MQIASLIVDAQPAELEAVRARLTALPGVEIHATDPQGRFIVTVESDDGAGPQTFDHMATLPGVMAVSLVFNQFEPEPEQEALHVQDLGALAP